jgi:hypothetical protein
MPPGGDDISKEPQNTGSFHKARHEVELPMEEISSQPEDREQAVEHSVFDEPALAGMLSKEEGRGTGLRYAEFLAERRARTGIVVSTLATIAVALASGPWGVVGSLVAQMGDNFFYVLMVVVFAPCIEEVMKVAAASFVVEKKPWLFRTRGQIVLVAALSGLTFATIENLMYLHVYIPDPSPAIVQWRWTVCVALHTGCSVIASLGLAKAWHEGMKTSTRPDLARAYPFMVAAVLVHGAYNAMAVGMSFALGEY